MVTLADVKAHLNITTDLDDALLSSKLAAALAYVASWVGVGPADLAARAPLANVYPNGTPPDLDEAVRQLTAHFYLNREAVNVQEGRAIVLPFGVADLIAPYRVYVF